MGICVGRMIKALGYLFKKLIKKFHQFCDILPAIISFMVVHLSTNFLAIYIINKQPTEQCIVLLFIPHEKYKTRTFFFIIINKWFSHEWKKGKQRANNIKRDVFLVFVVVSVALQRWEWRQIYFQQMIFKRKNLNSHISLFISFNIIQI